MKQRERHVSLSDTDKGYGLISIPSYILSSIQRRSRSVSVSAISSCKRQNTKVINFLWQAPTIPSSRKKSVQAFMNNLVIVNHDTVSHVFSPFGKMARQILKASLNVSSGCGRANDLLFKLTKEPEDPREANLRRLYHEFDAGREENPSRPTSSSSTSTASYSSTLVLAFAQWHLAFLLRLFLLVESAQCWYQRFRTNDSFSFVRALRSHQTDLKQASGHKWHGQDEMMTVTADFCSADILKLSNRCWRPQAASMCAQAWSAGAVNAAVLKHLSGQIWTSHNLPSHSKRKLGSSYLFSFKYMIITKRVRSNRCTSGANSNRAI